METTDSINEWAKEQFGDIPEQFYGRAVERAFEELIELWEELDHERGVLVSIGDEIADVAIVLMRLMGRFKYREGQCILPEDLQAIVDLKMKKNRGRKWASDGTGHGYHIKDM